MKTRTKSQILKIIDKKVRVRPVELVRTLQISPQAIHRQLKSMVQEGVLACQGRPPLTYYVLANVPDFSAAFAWLKAKHLNESPVSVCETRDILSARLGQLKTLVKEGLSIEKLPLVIATVGEIGNNSFDHNLGQWRDMPGCWFETQITGTRAWVCIADRGQGIFHSLSRVVPAIKNDQDALEIAFEKHVSGRAPEKRGNGLKFVKKNIIQMENSGLACFSGRGRLRFGMRAKSCEEVLMKGLSGVKGTVTLLAWELA